MEKFDFNNYKYHNKVVCFMDILGYKNIVNQTRNCNNLSDISELPTLSIIMQQYEKATETNDNKLTVRTFSDCMYVFCDLEDIEILLDFITTFQLQIFRGGGVNNQNLENKLVPDKLILARGGITYGEMYSSNNNFWGPAIIDAYQLESEIAIYPRIVIDYKFINAYVDKFNPNLDFIDTDSDFPYLNYIKYLHNTKNKICKSDIQRNIFDLQNYMQKKIDILNRHVFQKYKWLENYYQKNLSLWG